MQCASMYMGMLSMLAAQDHCLHTMQSKKSHFHKHPQNGLLLLVWASSPVGKGFEITQQRRAHPVMSHAVRSASGSPSLVLELTG